MPLNSDGTHTGLDEFAARPAHDFQDMPSIDDRKCVACGLVIRAVDAVRLPRQKLEAILTSPCR